MCPSFETLASQAPQDEVGEYTHNLERRDDWLRGPCLDLDTRFGPAARCVRAFARNLCPREGVGNAGRTMHPRSRVHLVVVKSTRVTTSTPKSPGIPARNGFNGLLRTLPGDRTLLPPSPCGLKVLSSPVEPNEPPQDLTPASRRQDHTTSPSASSAVVLRAANRSRRAIRPALASHA